MLFTCLHLVHCLGQLLAQGLDFQEFASFTEFRQTCSRSVPTTCILKVCPPRHERHQNQRKTTRIRPRHNTKKHKKIDPSIAENYNNIKPHGTPDRTGEMLHNHWKRVHLEIKNFQAYYVQAESILGSGGGGQDVLTNVMAQFH